MFTGERYRKLALVLLVAMFVGNVAAQPQRERRIVVAETDRARERGSGGEDHRRDDDPDERGARQSPPRMYPLRPRHHPRHLSRPHRFLVFL